jgi:hypothetical protein
MRNITSYRGYTICRSLRREGGVSIYSGYQRISGAEDHHAARVVIDGWLNAR